MLGERLLVLGERLPMLDGGERLWGRDVLIPLGFVADPDLPEEALRQATDLGPDEILLLRPDEAEFVPRSAFSRLSRAGLRLAGRGVAT